MSYTPNFHTLQLLSMTDSETGPTNVFIPKLKRWCGF